MSLGRREDAKNGEIGIMLGMLSAVERDSNVTQRHLSRELGIALGLANAYLKRCAKKGFIKIRQVPLNRYAYYLTPRGFAEKSRLTAEYLSVSFDFFRQARTDCTAVLREFHARGWRRVALCGTGELAEIAVLSSSTAEVAILCVIDPDPSSKAESCAGRPILKDPRQAGAFDAILVTDTRAPQQSFDDMLAVAAGLGFDAGRVVAPDLLHVTRRAAGAGQRQ